MRIRPVGAHALLLDLAAPPTSADGSATDPDLAARAAPRTPDPDVAPAPGGEVAALVEAWRAELWRRRDRGDLVADEIVPAAATVLLDGVPDPAATAARIADWTPGPPARTDSADRVDQAGTAGRVDQASTAGRVDQAGTGPVEVPVRYDGEDLPLVAAHWRVDVPAVVRRLRQTEFRVAFCGFAPGFGYLTGLPAELAVPRLASPRPRVPAGSVALAGPYAGIYPTASPGGWLLVGRTGLTLFDVTADPPALLTPGTRVRLVPA
ncbi:carboxyltransferase domain-containing protein [Micromonospora sp. WMMD1082]|uniref:5-oxoprolinase subunit B family protein n=1 Tax=Micromonospora sp. WMMD1082 TaxID=3016104 RepID=UPI0024178077|nr:carboxyltransferase domain-containing protein [Micromonospora sp. WMMD1082]MDG4794820.1 carboxyltransferase domain-containing protein [Micromonospora sp. WMMD1082]